MPVIDRMSAQAWDRDCPTARPGPGLRVAGVTVPQARTLLENHFGLFSPTHPLLWVPLRVRLMPPSHWHGHSQ
jgi:hypothetical protein